MLALSMMMGGREVFDLAISSNGGTWRRTVDAPQIPSTAPVLLILRLGSGIERQSASTSLGAIHLDDLADGSEVQFISSGFALGKGGAAGDGGGIGGSGAAGADGGPAIRADFNGQLVVTNSAGRIWGGGGGGGGGGGCLLWNAVDLAYDPHEGGGGGGGGAGGGALGSAGTGASNGTAGTTGSAGTAGSGGSDGDSNNAGDGGDGGAFGAAGSNGTTGSRHGSGPSDGQLLNQGAGGAAGYAILHNAGTVVSFISGSGSPNVKGSVGS